MCDPPPDLPYSNSGLRHLWPVPAWRSTAPASGASNLPQHVRSLCTGGLPTSGKETVYKGQTPLPGLPLRLQRRPSLRQLHVWQAKPLHSIMPERLQAHLSSWITGTEQLHGAVRDRLHGEPDLPLGRPNVRLSSGDDHLSVGVAFSISRGHGGRRETQYRRRRADVNSTLSNRCSPAPASGPPWCSLSHTRV